ncbi:MAG TPA: universal stress protein [Chloroflexota bacterium]|nr:universal stress protein [Chloroflexota bacterium]
MYRKILVPLDGSELAETALPHAGTIAAASGAELVLIRVCVPRFLGPQGNGGAVVQEAGDRAEAEMYLQEQQSRLRAKGIRVSYHVGTGNVADAIAKQARADDVDLIIMSTHGRTGTQLWAYGSVAYSMLKVATCSVLVVRTPRPQSADS